MTILHSNGPSFKVCKNSSCHTLNECVWTKFTNCDKCNGHLYQFCKNCANFYNPTHISSDDHRKSCTRSMSNRYVNDGDDITRIFSISKDGDITSWKCRSNMSIIGLEELYWMYTEPVKWLNNHNIGKKKLISIYRSHLISDYYENGDFFIGEPTIWCKVYYACKSKFGGYFDIIFNGGKTNPSLYPIRI
jgi:hypothetical protein